ncbi:MAG: uncharacterized protein JWP25_1913 [Bradyrhizobium sp.]|jgi:uncharacterized protein|nr:uncharacterized protein [Bradyrhizobium sp.]
MFHCNSLRKLTGGLVALSLLAASVPACAADYTPIDCSKASSSAERTICRSYPLGQAEARMATMFGVVTSLVAMGQRGDIVDAQRTWLKERNACGDDSACIARAYQSRITALSAVLDAIASRGPF